MLRLPFYFENLFFMSESKLSGRMLGFDECGRVMGDLFFDEFGCFSLLLLLLIDRALFKAGDLSK